MVVYELSVCGLESHFLHIQAIIECRFTLNAYLTWEKGSATFNPDKAYLETAK